MYKNGKLGWILERSGMSNTNLVIPYTNGRLGRIDYSHVHVRVIPMW